MAQRRQAASATLAHAAPEVLDGKQGSEATDVYALASTLHTLISGSPPFMRSSDEGLGVMMRRIMAEPPPDLRPLGVPDAVAEAIESSLTKDPEARPLTAAQFAEAIMAPLRPAAAPDQTSSHTTTPDAATGAGLGDHPTITEPPAAFAAPSAPSSGATMAVGDFGPAGHSPVEPPADAIPVLVADAPKRRGWLLATIGAIAILGIVGAAFALRGGDDGGADDEGTTLAADASTTTSTTSTTSTTEATTTTTTTADDGARATGAQALGKPSISIDCPIEIELGSTLICSITTAGVTGGEWRLPGFLSEPLPLQTINGVNDIFLEPTNGEAAGRRYTITATATTDAGDEIKATRTFLINVPTVSIDCPDKIAPGDSVVCEIISEHAVRGSWEIPGFGGDVLETIPGSNAIFINPNESVIGQTFTATATVEDDYGLTATASSDFTVTASAG
ncbi:MAG: hypothetical protein R2710_11490 [Acidimicrobiales bacterium]